MALSITSSYELVEHTESFEDKGFFAYTVKCTLLKNGQKITEGLGHANSKEKKWAYEFVYEKDLPPGTDKELLKKRKIESAKGTFYKYEIEADANSQDFDDLPSETQPTVQPVVNKIKQDTQAAKDFYCDDCGAGITEKVANYSTEKFGRTLCMACQKTINS